MASEENESKKLSEMDEFENIGEASEYIYMIRQNEVEGEPTYSNGKVSIDTLKRDIVEPAIQEAIPPQPDGFTVPYINMVPDWSSYIVVEFKQDSAGQKTTLDLPCDCFVYQQEKPTTSGDPTSAININDTKPPYEMMRNGVYVSAGSRLTATSSAGTTGVKHVIMPLVFSNTVDENCIIVMDKLKPHEITQIIQNQNFGSADQPIVPYDPDHTNIRNKMGVYGVYPEDAQQSNAQNIASNLNWHLIDTEDKSDLKYRQFALYCPLRDTTRGNASYFRNFNKTTGLYNFKTYTMESNWWGTSNLDGKLLPTSISNPWVYGRDYIMSIKLFNFKAV